MNVETVSLFLALLAVFAEASVVVAVVLLVGSRLSARVGRWRRAAVEAVGPQALALAFAVAAMATAGSLYFSEVAHFTPCRLCWYQRICMYPLVPILGLAALRRDRNIRPYAAILAGIGALIASYHVILERFPTLESNVCDPTTPCTVIWVQRLGYLTIPTMALSGFALVLTLLAMGAPTHLEGEPCPPDQTPTRTDPLPAEVSVARAIAGSHRSGSESVSSSPLPR